MLILAVAGTNVMIHIVNCSVRLRHGRNKLIILACDMEAPARMAALTIVVSRMNAVSSTIRPTLRSVDDENYLCSLEH